MTPLLQTFGNAARRAWSSVAIANGWIAYQPTGTGLYAYGTGQDATGNVLGAFRDTATSSYGGVYKFDALTGVLSIQKKTTSATIAPGGAAGDGANTYVSYQGYLVKYDSSLNEVWAKNSSGFGYNMVAPIKGTSLPVGGYNQNNTGAYFGLWNTSATVSWYKQDSSGSGVDTYPFATGNGTVYATTKQIIGFASFNAAGTKLGEFSNPTLAGETFNTLAVQGSGDNGGNAVLCIAGTTGTFVVKINATGVVQWQRKLAGVVGTGITVTDSADNVYASFQSGVLLYIVKYNSSGVLQWQRSIAISGGTTPYRANTGMYASADYLSFNTMTSDASNPHVVFKLTTAGYTGTAVIGGKTFTIAASTLTDTASTMTFSTTAYTGYTTPSFTWINQSPGYSTTTYSFTPKVL